MHVIPRLTSHPRVLFSFTSATEGANPYTTLLAHQLADLVGVQYFSWRAAFQGRYDLFHVQWPESLVRPYSQSRAAPAIGCVKFLLATALLLANRARGRKLVWTVHNRKPHERGSLTERLFIRLFLRLVDHRVYLNEGETDQQGRPSTVILHPDYSPVAERPREVGPPIDMLLFGLLRPYKGVEGLIGIVNNAPELGTLLIAGGASDLAYAGALERLAASSPSVRLDVRRLPQDELNSTIARSRLVILPYAYVYNSGSLLLSLTLGTPVLVRSSSTTLSMQAEVGDGWVSIFEGDLTTEDVERALRRADSLDRVSGPNLSRRSWEECAERHTRLYGQLAVSPVPGKLP